MKKAKAKTAKTAKTTKAGDGSAPIAALVLAVGILTDAVARSTSEITRLCVAIEAGGLPGEQARNPEPSASEQ